MRTIINQVLSDGYHVYIYTDLRMNWFGGFWGGVNFFRHIRTVSEQSTVITENQENSNVILFY